jgi:hypothetical protein
VASHLWHTFPVSSQHSGVALGVRLDPQVKAKGSEALDERDLEMTSFIVACLLALAADPDLFLAGLRPYWPRPKPRGRPRSRETAAPQAPSLTA